MCTRYLVPAEAQGAEERGRTGGARTRDSRHLKDKSNVQGKKVSKSFLPLSLFFMELQISEEDELLY